MIKIQAPEGVREFLYAADAYAFMQSHPAFAGLTPDEAAARIVIDEDERRRAPFKAALVDAHLGRVPVILPEHEGTFAALREYAPELYDRVLNPEVKMSWQTRNNLARPLFKQTLRRLDTVLKQDEQQKREKTMQIMDARQKAELLREYDAWSQFTALTLEKNTCSRLHHLKGAFMEGRTAIATPDRHGALTRESFVREDVLEMPDTWLDAYKPFVVEHDWARAFEGATDFDGGDIRLPFPECAFEFRISGRTIVALARQPVEGPIVYRFCFQLEHWWCLTVEDAGASPDFSPDGFHFALKQVRAICIALGAEAAVRDVIRAPDKLNRKRAAKGAPLLLDYHVVKLNRGARAGRNPHPTATGRKVRLHFRRGHWRHYTDYKTWIEWMLVGDPDLGWVDKEYRL